MALLSRFAVAAAIVLTLTASTVLAQGARIGDHAPAFSASDSHGQSQSLAQYKGKFVVLEWHNKDCPFTKKHYTSGNMQALQKQWTAQGVIWFTVISSAPGKQGYVTADQENAYLLEAKATPTAALLDPDGRLARLYDAKTTPQILLIAPDGKTLYNGAIDDKPSTDPEDVKTANNYASEALTAALSGKAIPTPFTRPYGCSIKYAD